jgi:hypothetical protein
MQARRASVMALGFSLAGVLLVVLLVGVAAGVGPSGLTHGTPHDPIFHAPRPHPASASTQSTGSPSSSPLPKGTSDIPGAALIGLAIRAALALWLIWLLMRGALWLREELAARRRREPEVAEIDFDVLDDPEPLVDELRRDADLQMEMLLRGTPRNGIVACWERFEEQAERVGLARRSSETSSEFTLRLLDVVAADQAAVSSLAGLYREARFSEHEITEDNRDEAVADLQRIRASLGRRPVVS